MEGSTQTTYDLARDSHIPTLRPTLGSLAVIPRYCFRKTGNPPTSDPRSRSKVLSWERDRRTDPVHDVDRLRTLLLPRLEENIDRLREIVFHNPRLTQKPDQLLQAAMGALSETEQTIRHDLNNINSSL
ncbi:hypothetical protein PCANC_05457 [Puccinia coronata f. sp. avenae]|uniref:Uncharacterized protein n=1 Tax=Puccinia coronata f. sp. avenae TaxID=200324 RepID=A0A2N5T6K9_9BASI|nr:hypothetical protein PCANC_05457 [Puccinia coronata f. sp. avenae]